MDVEEARSISPSKTSLWKGLRDRGSWYIQLKFNPEYHPPTIVMPALPRAPPVLSTPDTHILEDSSLSRGIVGSRLSEVDLYLTYEIQRTVAEIQKGKWRRIALQFPDSMLPDAPRVFEALQRGLGGKRIAANGPVSPLKIYSQSTDVRSPTDEAEKRSNDLVSEPRHISEELGDLTIHESPVREKRGENVNESLGDQRLYILADTSYGACCVDEIAAEHVDADVVVHYGRTCLSPTARLPVIYIFTHQPLTIDPLLQAFELTYPNRQEKVILMADVTFHSHLDLVVDSLHQRGYTSIYKTEVIHNPSSLLPNRTIPPEVQSNNEILKDWKLFHISNPPPSLLLTLSSRLSSIHIYPTDSPPSSFSSPYSPLQANTYHALRRRYALLTSLSTTAIFGILINTLSVKNYLHIVSSVQQHIRAAGKKSYTFVVGKINAAKIANFSEVGGWVVIGCWESSLVEDGEFWKPVITPFELELCLKGDDERIWTGEWRADWQGVRMKESQDADRDHELEKGTRQGDVEHETQTQDGGDWDSEPESTPPEFDLRTGRYISRSRPMRNQFVSKPATADARGGTIGTAETSQSLIKRFTGDVAVIGNEISPGAEFLRSQRTWQGLGSDFEIAYDEVGNEAGTAIEEGRRGIASGYVVGEGVEKS